MSIEELAKGILDLMPGPEPMRIAYLAAALRAYGDERAREMRERAVSVAQKRASDWSSIKDQDPDPRWTAKWQEAADLMALISDLPDS